MASDIFRAILDEKIENLKYSFIKAARNIYFDDDQNKLIHAGEYGLFREEAFREFLKFTTPSKYNIGDGFIITPTGKRSTQCDIVIYDGNNTPITEDTKQQKFYTIETVLGIGEVKSELSKTELKTALNKLARNKALRREIINPSLTSHRMADGLNDFQNPRDQLFSFLICKKLKFDSSELLIEFDQLYDTDIEYRDRHNLILSLEDGLFLYFIESEEQKLTWSYPTQFNINNKNRSIFTQNNCNEHILDFCNELFQGINEATVYIPDTSHYIGITRTAITKDEI